VFYVHRAFCLRPQVFSSKICYVNDFVETVRLQRVLRCMVIM